MKLTQEFKTKLSIWFTDDEMDVNIQYVPWLFGQADVTIGRTIFIKGKPDTSPYGISLLGHALVHVQQYKGVGVLLFWVMWVLNNKHLEETARAMQARIFDTLVEVENG